MGYRLEHLLGMPLMVSRQAAGIVRLNPNLWSLSRLGVVIRADDRIVCPRCHGTGDVSWMEAAVDNRYLDRGKSCFAGCSTLRGRNVGTFRLPSPGQYAQVCLAWARGADGVGRFAKGELSHLVKKCSPESSWAQGVYSLWVEVLNEGR